MAYWRLYYHVVWATYGRLPLITGGIKKQVYGVVLQKARELGVVVHAIGGIEDHIHVVVSIPPKLAVAQCVKHFKGASARYVNEHSAHGTFKWQDGYGVLTFGGGAMKTVVSYVLNQGAHHGKGALRPSFERMTGDDDGVRSAGSEGSEAELKD